MLEHRRGASTPQGAPFQLALREPCVRAPVRRTALVMLQHHGGRPSCQRHEHKALKTPYVSPDGLSARGIGLPPYSRMCTGKRLCKKV